MKNRGVLIIAAVVVVVLAIGGYLIFSGVVPGGQARTIDVTVTGDKMSPSTITVHQGDRVTLNITADKKEEIHLHGYDIHFEIDKAGGRVSHTFTADRTGDFPIEIEGGAELGSLRVA
jgi:FtsP/CotA-like multicopper oxidase with cupredoxin domain